MKVGLVDKFEKNIHMFSSNLKEYMYINEIKAKEMTKLLNVAESTVNDYINEKRLPNTQVLLELLELFPEIPMEDWLTRKIDFLSKVKSVPTLSENLEIKKYFGSYIFFYFQTDKIDETTSVDKKMNVPIKCGVLCVFEKNNSINANEAQVIAVLGLDRKTANRMQKDTSKFCSKIEFEEYMSKYSDAYHRKVYTGELILSVESVFITFRQLIEKKDFAHIVLSRYNFNSDHYIGGIGTVSSTSTGSPSIPVVQLIAIAREDDFRIDENSIYNTLLFKTPMITHSINQDYPECTELLNFSKEIYENTKNSEYQKILFQSKLDYLLFRYMEDHKLCYAKVKREAAKEWYKVLKYVDDVWGSIDYEDEFL